MVQPDGGSSHSPQAPPQTLTDFHADLERAKEEIKNSPNRNKASNPFLFDPDHELDSLQSQELFDHKLSVEELHGLIKRVLAVREKLKE